MIGWGQVALHAPSTPPDVGFCASSGYRQAGGHGHAVEVRVHSRINPWRSPGAFLRACGKVKCGTNAHARPAVKRVESASGVEASLARSIFAYGGVSIPLSASTSRRQSASAKEFNPTRL